MFIRYLCSKKKGVPFNIPQLTWGVQEGSLDECVERRWRGKDFKRIEELFYNFSAEFDQKLERQTAVFQGQLESHSRDFRNWIGTERESFQHTLDLVVEGQQMLVERMDRLEGRMDRLENRVDDIAVDLAAHRRDTEAHRKGWRVREE